MTTNSKRPATLEEEAAERSVRSRWNTDRALRAEFADDLVAAVAYAKAEARGQVRITGGGTVRLERHAAPAAELDAGAPDAHPGSRPLRPAAEIPAQDLKDLERQEARDRQVASALAATWYSELSLQQRFPTCDAYIEAVRSGKERTVITRSNGHG